MNEYAVYDTDDLGLIFSEIYSHVLTSYSLGHTGLKIYLHSSLAYRYLVTWMPGWVRRAGPNGIWRTSRGEYCLLYLKVKIF